MTENVSSVAVSFHYIKPWRQILLHYVIYNVTKYGIEQKYLPLPKERPANRKYENVLRANALYLETIPETNLTTVTNTNITNPHIVKKQ